MADSGRTVVITGGSRGIGRAVAFRFAEEKCRIIIIHYDPDESAANETLNNLAARGIESESHKLDVSSYGEAKALFEKILAKFGTVDVLVNNAGITRDIILMRMSEDDWDTVIRVNLKSVFNCTRAVLRPMARQRQGRIVNMSSVVGQIGSIGQANYAASKAGIIGFTKAVAREVAARGITVNSVVPGLVDTEMTASLPIKAKESFLQQIPLGRIGQPEDIAEVVFWLCSPAASYITGQTIHVNGGMVM